MVLASVHEPWYRSLVASLRSSAEEKKLPPLKLTARPVAVKSIWGAYDNKKSGVSSSLIAHCAFVTAVFLLSATPVIQNALKGSVTLVIPVDISAYVKLNMPAEGKAGGGGGGGLSSPLAASKGKRPRFAMRQFAPPTPVPVNENPKLSVEPTLLGPPQLQVPNVDMAVFGDPLAAVGPPSAGPGVRRRHRHRPGNRYRLGEGRRFRTWVGWRRRWRRLPCRRRRQRSAAGQED